MNSSPKSSLSRRPLPPSRSIPRAVRSSPNRASPVDRTGFLATMASRTGSIAATSPRRISIAKGASPAFASGNWGIKTWTFAGNTWKLDQGSDGGDPCFGTYEPFANEHLVFVTSGGGCGVEGWMVWRPDGGEDVVLKQLAGAGISYRDLIEITAFLDRVWTKID